MAKLNETPSSNRLHIGVFGKTNSGKSSFINAFTKQKVSIVSDVQGTTTDPVYKAMEIHPLGPCVFIDTAGYNDETELGEMRMEKTRLAAEKTDIAVIVMDAKEICTDSEFATLFPEEEAWRARFKKSKTPILMLINKADEVENAEELCTWMKAQTKEEVLLFSAVKEQGIGEVKTALARLMPEDFGTEYITGELVTEKDLVLLVMPQDIQAPKGRLILPQVQTLRELLDKKCLVMSCTTDQFEATLAVLKEAPKLIITDSQVFGYVYEHKPAESMLTSFSVLFAAYKGDLAYYVESAKALDTLTEQSRVLIAECCTHAPLQEDIGRVKIPTMLRKRVGQGLSVDVVSGTDFPEDVAKYDIIIQCGGCMFNRKYVLARIDKAKVKKVPMTNYGITIAHLTGILDKISMNA